MATKVINWRTDGKVVMDGSADIIWTQWSILTSQKEQPDIMSLLMWFNKKYRATLMKRSYQKQMRIWSNL